MRQMWLGFVMCGAQVLVGCGGSTAAAPGGEAANEAPLAGAGSGGGGGDGALPTEPRSQLGGTGGSASTPPQGICAKLCINTATFLFDSPLSIDELSTGSVKACRNGDQECFTGTLPARGTAGNTVTFAESNAWDGPNVWSPDGWKTIQYSWGSLQPQDFHDGDRFTLSFVSADDEDEALLFDQVATFETVVDCAGSCLSARYDLRGTAVGEGGT